MDWGLVIIIAIVTIGTAIHSGISAAFEMLIALVAAVGAYHILRRAISCFLTKKKERNNRSPNHKLNSENSDANSRCLGDAYTATREQAKKESIETLSFGDSLSHEIDTALSAIIMVKETYSNDKAYAVTFLPCRDAERSQAINKPVYRIEISVLIVDSLYENDPCTANFYDWFRLSKGDSAGYNTYSHKTSNYYIGEYKNCEQAMERYLSESETFAKYKQMLSLYEK